MKVYEAKKLTEYKAAIAAGQVNNFKVVEERVESEGEME